MVLEDVREDAQLDTKVKLEYVDFLNSEGTAPLDDFVELRRLRPKMGASHWKRVSLESSSVDQRIEFLYRDAWWTGVVRDVTQGNFTVCCDCDGLHYQVKPHEVRGGLTFDPVSTTWTDASVK